MRCESCGGYPHHLVTTADGRQLLQCRTGISVMGRQDPTNPQRIVTGIVQCGLVCDNQNKKVSGKFVYMVADSPNSKLKPEALTIRDGRIIY